MMRHREDPVARPAHVGVLGQRRAYIGAESATMLITPFGKAGIGERAPRLNVEASILRRLDDTSISATMQAELPGRNCHGKFTA